MDVPRPRKWPLIKVFQVVSPGSHDRSNPIGTFPCRGLFPGISVSHISNIFPNYQISGTELSCLNILVIVSSKFLLIFGQANDRRFPIFFQQVQMFHHYQFILDRVEPTNSCATHVYLGGYDCFHSVRQGKWGLSRGSVGCHSVCLQNVGQLLGPIILSTIQSSLQSIQDCLVNGLGLPIALRICRGRVLVHDV